jgi:hypothetical protein
MLIDRLAEYLLCDVLNAAVECQDEVIAPGLIRLGNPLIAVPFRIEALGHPGRFAPQFLVIVVFEPSEAFVIKSYKTHDVRGQFTVRIDSPAFLSCTNAFEVESVNLPALVWRYLSFQVDKAFTGGQFAQYLVRIQLESPRQAIGGFAGVVHLVRVRVDKIGTDTED